VEPEPRAFGGNGSSNRGIERKIAVHYVPRVPDADDALGLAHSFRRDNVPLAFRACPGGGGFVPMRGSCASVGIDQVITTGVVLCLPLSTTLSACAGPSAVMAIEKQTRCRCSQRGRAEGRIRTAA
jgi:hypothetical protein